jgi:aminopeptidase N
MFEAWVGAERWRTFIHDYLSAHAWGNASADDFLGAVSTKLGPPVAAGLRTFLEQPGVPRIELALRCADGTADVALHQRRALPAGVSEPTARLWKVPVCVRYGDAKVAARACTLLDGADGTLPLPPLPGKACPSWLVPNADAAGYYRSVVTPAQVRALLAPGAPAKLTAGERLMVIADLLAAIDRGEQLVDARLTLAPTIAADPDDKVAAVAVEAAGLRDDVLDADLHVRYQRALRGTFGARATKLGWARAAAAGDERHALRRALVPMIARAGDRALTAEGRRLADAWLADPAKAGLADDLVAAALAVAAADGDAARFGRYLAAAHAAVDRTNQDRLIAALGGFHAPALAARARAVLLDGTFDLRGAVAILRLQLATRETKADAWTWLEAHLDELLARMRSDEASWLLGEAAGAFCDPAHRAAAATLLVPRAAKIDGAQNAVERGLQEVDRCIATTARELPVVRRFLGRR